MTGTDIETAVQYLQDGQLVAIPTETVYGLAANALDEKAVSKIFAAKNRPSFDPLIVHFYARENIDKFVKNIPAAAEVLMKKFCPGPLTLLLEKTSDIPDLVTAGSPLVAIRFPAHELTRRLLLKINFPLAAPSANPFGYISPTTAIHVASQLGDEVAYILDGGPSTVGIESTIVGFEKNTPVIFRKGGIAVEAIEAAIGPVEVRAFSSSDPKAPGMLKSHYAPRTPLIIGDIAAILKKWKRRKIGVISFKTKYTDIPSSRQVVLSENQDLEEAARRLFAGMRALDAMDLELIVAEEVPNTGLGRAINDRLRRAAFRD